MRAIVDKVLEMGDGDAAVGTVRAFAAGVLDVPWSPNRHVKSRVMPARDADGYLRILEPGALPLPRDILDVHEAGLRARAAKRSASRSAAISPCRASTSCRSRSIGWMSDGASRPAASA